MIKIAINIFLLLNFAATLAQDNLRINEFLASNINGLVDIETGEYSDWIEIYNPTDSTIYLNNHYLSDDLNNLQKWQFPNTAFINPNSYLIVWADDKNNGLHTNFKLDVDGEQIILSKNEIIDSVTYNKLRNDISFGRDIFEPSNWHYFGEPTPGFPNSTMGVKTNKLSDEPICSIESGFYSTGLKVDISTKNIGTIYYSLDGSIPRESNGLIYNAPIILDSTTVLRTVFIEEGLLPSKVISHHYFIDENSDLPVMSLITEPKNFWDDEIGIYAKGTNGLSFWNVMANYWQDWERPANVQYFESNQTKAFELDAGIAISGARRNLKQKSFRLFARSKYGKEFINYKLFPNKEVRNFSSLILRNGGYPDFKSSLIRDGLIQTLASNEMDIEYQGYQPCILFINGKYWGIYNIREKQNEEYLKENNGVDPANLDMLENNMEVVEGDNIHYQNMLDFIEANDLSVNANYDSVKNLIDINNFIDYQIIQLFAANIDWPANNIKYWRPKTIDGKWRWMLFDIDAGFGLWSNYDFNSLEFATKENSTSLNNLPWSTFLFRNLLKNQEFVDRFAQKFAAYISYAFNSETTLNLIEQFSDKIKNKIPRHIDRWSPGCNENIPEFKDGCVFDNIDTWNTNIEVIRDFARKRPQFMMKHLMNFFSITDTIQLEINTSIPNEGTVTVNGVIAKNNIAATLFSGKELIVEAKPNAGYKFLRWEGSISSNQTIIKFTPNENISLTPVFEPLGINTIPNIITANLELLKENSPYLINGDTYIYEDAILIIHPGVQIEISEGSSIYVFGGLEIHGTKDEVVEIKSKDNNKWGAVCFINAKKKSKIYHTKISGATKGKDALTQIGGISSFNSNLELNYVSMENVEFPIYVEKGSFSMRNSKIKTEVTSDGINARDCNVIVEHCEFIGGNSIDTDAIDYDDVKNGIIRRNIIHDFLGENSDGIDIGEKSKNILIEDNLIYNCSDKGISIGQESKADIRGNIILNCNLGVGIKDEGSYGYVDHNTFYSNNISVSCFEKTIGKGGGNAEISNSIFSNSKSNDIFIDQYSTINIKYSLSDSEHHLGEGNIFGDPQFVNTAEKDFRLSSNSPAIDNGDPNYDLDPDGSRTNIGATYNYFYNTKQIIISEINYHSSSDFDSKDWIEFYNPQDEPVDISNWIFKDSKNDHRYIFPMGTKISSNGYIVLSEDIKSFNDFYPNINNVIGNMNFGLNNSGERIRLFDNYSNIIDSLTYDDILPWTKQADGEGYTLQLINHELDNSLPENWDSSVLHGTPGEENRIVAVQIDKEKLPKEFSLSQNYPNPFNPATTIQYSIPQFNLGTENTLPTGRQVRSVQLKIFDILGREVVTLIDEKQKPGSYEVAWNGTSNSGVQVSSGVYFYRLSINEISIVKKMVLTK